MIKKIDKFTLYLGYFAASILSILVILIVYDASARYMFSEGSTALQELEWHLFDVVMLFAIAYTLHQNAHVRVDIFYDKYSHRTKTIINLLSALFLIIPFSLLVVYQGLHFVEMSFIQMEGSSDPGGLPYRFLVKSLMPLGFILLILQAVKEVLTCKEELSR